MARIDINEKVLSKNDLVALRLRQKFKDSKTLVINLASSPGSGKTTLLEKVLPDISRKYHIAVIEGDMRTENDADRLRALGIKAIQIQTGDGCHLEASQIENLLPELGSDLDLLIVENIGNLICPASYDLGEDYFFIILSVTEGEDKPLKYPTIFHKADYFILNKIDLLPYLDFDVEKCLEYVKKINSAVNILPLSAKSYEGIDDFSSVIVNLIEAKKSFS